MYGFWVAEFFQKVELTTPLWSREDLGALVGLWSPSCFWTPRSHDKHSWSSDFCRCWNESFMTQVLWKKKGHGWTWMDMDHFSSWFIWHRSWTNLNLRWCSELTHIVKKTKLKVRFQISNGNFGWQKNHPPPGLKKKKNLNRCLVGQAMQRTCQATEPSSPGLIVISLAKHAKPAAKDWDLNNFLSKSYAKQNWFEQFCPKVMLRNRNFMKFLPKKWFEMLKIINNDAHQKRKTFWCTSSQIYQQKRVTVGLAMLSCTACTNIFYVKQLRRDT